MSNSKLIELSYYDPSAQVRLSAYADTLVLDHDQNGSIISAIRFGGYPEMVRAMADAIYGGATIEAAQNDTTRMLQSSLKSYQRQITHDGIYAVATLMAADTVQEDDRSGKHEKAEDTDVIDTEQMELQPRRCYIFCPAGDQRRLFEELDRKTAAPLIPEFQDYVLSSLRQRGDLRQLEVISLKERIDAWVIDLKPQDQNVVEVLEQGLQSGAIQIPGTLPGSPDGFENVENVTGYLNTFGVTVADRIRNQFMPLFDPAKEPLSDEVLAINDCIMSRVGYSLYDAQLAVAEAVKRQLARMQSPDAAHIFCQSHPVVDMEELLMVIDEVMWDIFDDVNFFFDEEYEATVVQCSHPVIDRLYELGRASDPKHGSRQSVWSKKLHDITEYFVLGATNSVYKFSQHIAGDHVVLEFCLSPDYYEPLYFANSLVDLLRYCQCSIRRIEAKLAERETENTRKEAA